MPRLPKLSNEDNKIFRDVPALDLANLNLENDSSEDKWYKSGLLRARDSLENLAGYRSNKTVGDAVNSRPFSHSSTSHGKRFSSTGPQSDPSLGSDATTDSTGKVNDPRNKIGRKTKKENKRRKPLEKSPDMDYQPSPKRRKVQFREDVSVITDDEVVTKPLKK